MIERAALFKEIALDSPQTLYIFLDEGGNFDFSATGSRFFTLTCVSMARPFLLHTVLDTYKYDLIEYRKEPRIDIEAFHCADDNQYVRKRVLGLIAEQLPSECVDAIVIEKSKTGPSLQLPEKFYPKMLGYLLRFAMLKCPTEIGELVIITDTIPVRRKLKAIEKALKTVSKEMLPKRTPFRIMHHSSKAHYGLQVADYLNWTVFRKWEHSDCSYYDSVLPLIRSEFEIFRSGTTYYYDV